MVKIVADAGHAGFGVTPGKRSPANEYEWTFNDKVVDAFMLFLSKYENVQLLRVDDSSGKVDIPLSTRTNKANAWGADVYISFHHNALTGVWGNHGGVETFVHPQSSKASKDIQKVLQANVLKAMGIADRGAKTADFHVLRETNMPAILVEGGFMDSRIDIKAMRDDKRLKAQGEAVAKGLVEYFNLKLKDGVKPVVKEVVTPISKPIVKEEEIELIEKAIVINSFVDYPAVQKLHIRKGYPIFERAAIKEKVAKELIIAGGGTKGLDKFGDRLTDLSGKSREETVANVADYMNK